MKIITLFLYFLTSFSYVSRAEDSQLLCTSQTNQFIGESVGAQMSNKWEIDQMLSSEDWEMSKFTACEDETETLSGL